MRATTLNRTSRLALDVQGLTARVFGPITVTGIVVAMRFLYRWRIRNHRAIRRRFLADLRAADGPVMICANHLTMVDSPIVSWGLAPSWWYVLRSSKLPWNVPERENFAATLVNRIAIYLLKCIPITRGGDRSRMTRVLDRLSYLLSRGEIVMMFPEGGRSRTGRVESSQAAHGVGRLVKANPGTRVLCVYLRGDHQSRYSRLPAKGEVFHLATSWLEPTTEHAGLRGSVAIAAQILTRLEEMESEYLDGRQ